MSMKLMSVRTALSALSHGDMNCYSEKCLEACGVEGIALTTGLYMMKNNEVGALVVRHTCPYEDTTVTPSVRLQHTIVCIPLPT